MTITLSNEDLEETLDKAFLLAAGGTPLPERWLSRARQLSTSPSVAFIAAVGAALLAKATDDRVDSFVIQRREGSAGAYSLRHAATALARKRHAYGYDIGSSSDRDPINHGTLVSSKRWDLALERITPRHKPFFQIVLRWLGDINTMSQDEAVSALAAFLRVRREVATGASIQRVPTLLGEAPPLSDLVDALEAFSSADAEGGARGMALVAAAYRAAGFDADLPSRNDPRRIDVPIKREGTLVIGAEVKQQPTHEGTADSLARDAAAAGARRALLAVLPPGELVDVDVSAVLRRAERNHGVVMRLATNAREVIHEALMSTQAGVDDFCAALPRAFAEALRDIRASEDTIDTWTALAQRWT